MSTSSISSHQPLQPLTPLILVADDDDISRAMFYEALSQVGYRVIQASNGQECLTAYLRYSPDLVLLDLEMPGMNGFQCCQKLQSLISNAPASVIIVSAFTNPESMEQAFAVGATDYLTKPILWPLLKQRVQYVLQTRQTIANLKRQLQQEQSTALALETQLQEQADEHIQFYQTVQAQVGQLEHLNQLKDELLNTVSHELRSPLSNMSLAIQMLEKHLELILNQTETLLSSRLELQKVLSYLKVLRDQCQREIYLVNNLLDLQHLETGKQPLFPELLDLSEWLPSVMAPFLQRANERQQSLQIQAASKLPFIKTDPLLLERILTELLMNACKYAPPQATITVSVQEGMISCCPAGALSFCRTIQICVSNTGVEIPVEALSQIFDPFYRVPKSDRWKQGGSGLGLALVQKMVQHLQGTVQVCSAPDLTQFTIELPLALNGNETDFAIAEPASIKTYKPVVRESV